MTAVGEVFQNTLHHALSIHPTHTAWLRTKGDVMYSKHVLYISVCIIILQ